jgi:hypothetical protein
MWSRSHRTSRQPQPRLPEDSWHHPNFLHARLSGTEKRHAYLSTCIVASGLPASRLPLTTQVTRGGEGPRLGHVFYSRMLAM